MQNKQGSLSINSENIFPIIKKWLYSDHDIFIRELISNGCDAITKLKKLDMMGEYTLPDDFKAKIRVIANPEKKTLQFIDNGLGMTADEVEEYINQIAFSGATDFLSKYKDKTNEDQIIGHFGLGFYSAFMVANEVHIDTLSYQADATPVHWECDGGTEYEMDAGTKDSVGTTITLFLNEDCLEFANEYRVREILRKYCSFMPTEIYLEKADAPLEFETILPEEKLDSDIVVETVKEEEIEKLKIQKRPVAINETQPLWTKNPSECTEEEYKAFYRKVFNDYKEPLFWIHLNMDYPFNLKGILYFPKINSEYDSLEGTIKLYNNQVFIADNIKEVIPEFLMLLKGVIDCPDLPLNVSRSALQNDGFVKKISDYISKKVADKLSGMCKTEKEIYEKYWDDISPFVKYGCLKDDKFCDKMNDFILFKNLEHNYLTLPECLIKKEDSAENSDTEQTVIDEEGNEIDQEESATDSRTPIYYVTDEIQQSQYINLFKEQGLDAIILNHNIDTSFISQLEQRNEHYRFIRIDSDLTEDLKHDLSEDELKEEVELLNGAFCKALGREKMEIKVEKLKNSSVAALLTISEENRRMQDMMKMYGMSGMDPGMFGQDENLTLNASHPLVQYLVNHPDSSIQNILCQQLYDLALLANKPLSSDEMTRFVSRSNEIMLKMTENLSTEK